jgi:N-hydroxyarylamine O-acetyltransferase
MSGSLVPTWIFDPFLPPELVERVLDKLGHRGPPPTTIDGLTDLYRSWCRAVPFDNVQFVLRSPLPSGDEPVGLPARTFFAEWLRDGTGGLCGPATWAWHSLLRACGFPSACAIAAINGDHLNHLTAVVELDGTRHVVDAAYQNEVPVPLRVEAESRGYGTGLHEATVRPSGSSWIVTYRAPAQPGDHHCLLSERDANPRVLAGGLRRGALSRMMWMAGGDQAANRRVRSSLFCRRNTADGHVVVIGPQVIRVRHDSGIIGPGVETLEAGLRALGYSSAIVERLGQISALADQDGLEVGSSPFFAPGATHHLRRSAGR